MTKERFFLVLEGRHVFGAKVVGFIGVNRGSISFIFMQFSTKILPSNRFLLQIQGLVFPSEKSWKESFFWWKNRQRFLQIIVLSLFSLWFSQQLLLCQILFQAKNTIFLPLIKTRVTNPEEMKVNVFEGYMPPCLRKGTHCSLRYFRDTHQKYHPSV